MTLKEKITCVAMGTAFGLAFPFVLYLFLNSAGGDRPDKLSPEAAAVISQLRDDSKPWRTYSDVGVYYSGPDGKESHFYRLKVEFWPYGDTTVFVNGTKVTDQFTSVELSRIRDEAKDRLRKIQRAALRSLN